jgi:hypothetical protein
MEYNDCAVTVSVGDKEFSRTYKQIVRTSLTTDDILKLLSDEKTAKSVISDWHYGQDLRAKAEVRNAILNEVAGPEKAIEKLAKDLFKARAANGKPITEEQSVKMAKMYLEMESASEATV